MKHRVFYCSAVVGVGVLLIGLLTWINRSHDAAAPVQQSPGERQQEPTRVAVASAPSVPATRQASFDFSVIAGEVDPVNAKSLDSAMVYKAELLGLLSLGSRDAIKAAQRQKLGLLPPQYAGLILECEGMWYLALYREILEKDDKYGIPPQRIQAILDVAGSTIEVLLEGQSPKPSRFLGELAAYYAEAGRLKDAQEIALKYLQTAQLQQDSSPLNLIEGMIARARLSRLANTEEGTERAKRIYTDALEATLPEGMKQLIIAERDSPELPSRHRGSSLYQLDGASLASVIGTEVGPISRQMEEGQTALLDALRNTEPPSSPYQPGWTGVNALVSDVPSLVISITKNLGFRQDPYSRLYQAAALLHRDGANSLGLAGLAQSLQEMELLDASERVYKQSEAAISNWKSPVGRSDMELLGRYVQLRRGYTAAAQLRWKEARDYWQRAANGPVETLGISRIANELLDYYK